MAVSEYRLERVARTLSDESEPTESGRIRREINEAGSRRLLDHTPGSQGMVAGWKRREHAESISISSEKAYVGTPNGIRTRAATLKGWCPRPLDDGGWTAVRH